jgi:peptidoglycan/xylan/chitin deacetylase (PgdA/CDA1 family)
MKYLFITCIAAILCLTGFAQQGSWKGKQCAVVLTYDDAIDIDLDHVIPALDSFQLKGTFYLIGASPVIDKRLHEWRSAAANGHELGNHALMHPCDGSKPGRGFVTPENDLSKYSVARAVTEIRQNNVLLKAIDGKERRTFAYPCGDLTVNGVFFYEQLRNEFACARGVAGGIVTPQNANYDNINSYVVNGQDGNYLISLVKQAEQSGGLVVFLFHGVGGGHNINVSSGAHTELLRYLAAGKDKIWVTTMVDAADYMRELKR